MKPEGGASNPRSNLREKTFHFGSLKHVHENRCSRVLRILTADGTFIEAPSSTKNKAHARDPEMASGKKANTWHFGMKEHIAACSESGIIYGTVAAPANEHDITHLGDLLKGLEKKVFLDSGYSGCRKLKFRRFLSRTCHGTLLPGRAHGRRNCQSVRTLEANLVKRSSNA